MMELAAAAIPLIAGWIFYVDRKVASHDAVIKRLDKLIDLLLEERLNAQSQAWGQAPKPYYRGSRY